MRLLISGSWVRAPRWAQIRFLNLLASSYLQKGEINKTSWNRAGPSVIKINTQGRVYIHSEDQEAKKTLYLKYAGPVLRSKCNPGNETFVPLFYLFSLFVPGHSCNTLWRVDSTQTDHESLHWWSTDMIYTLVWFQGMIRLKTVATRVAPKLTIGGNPRGGASFAKPNLPARSACPLSGKT